MTNPMPPAPAPADAVDTPVLPPLTAEPTPPAAPEPQAATPALVGTVVGEVLLPSGGRVVLRDPKELRARDRRAVQRAIVDPNRRMAAALDVLDGTICMLVESWTIPYLPGAALPKDNPDILGELTIPDMSALEDAARPAMATLFPSEESAEDAATPGSPTPPASV